MTEHPVIISGYDAQDAPLSAAKTLIRPSLVSSPSSFSRFYRIVDPKITLPEHGAVKCILRRFGAFLLHFHKSETARAARFTIGNEVHRMYLSMLGE